MKSYVYFLILTLGVILSSCKDEIVMDSVISEIPGDAEIKPLSNDDIIYVQQTDKTRMLYSLIYWDNEKNAYILDLSEKDRDTLGIDTNIYEKAKDFVEQLNTSLQNETN